MTRIHELSPKTPDARFPGKGDVCEAAGKVEVGYLTTWAEPYSGGGKAMLREGERVRIPDVTGVLNVHEREILAEPGEVGALMESLASEGDRLWPRKSWPAMRFDRPLGVGAAGGHGPIRYVVEEYRPGERVVFRFTAPRGFEGHHRFDVVPRGGRRTVLRHTLAMNAHGMAAISWPLVLRPLHDALIEDALAQAQASLGEASVVRPWSPWTKFLRFVISRGRSRGQPVPDASPR